MFYGCHIVLMLFHNLRYRIHNEWGLEINLAWLELSFGNYVMDTTTLSWDFCFVSGTSLLSMFFFFFCYQCYMLSVCLYVLESFCVIQALRLLRLVYVFRILVSSGNLDFLFRNKIKHLLKVNKLSITFIFKFYINFRFQKLLHVLIFIIFYSIK